MNSIRSAATLAVFILSTVVGPVRIASGADTRVYVAFAANGKAAAASAVTASGGRVHHEFDDLGAIAVSIPEQALGGISRNPNIISIEPDPERHLRSQTVPYGIDMVQAPLAVADGAIGTGITVGVIDSGVYVGHEDLGGLVIGGSPSSGPNAWYVDGLGHGTHVTGTIVAADNSLGVIGVSPGAVSIYMVRVFGDTGEWVYSSDLLAAARAAQAAGADIISMSLGGSRASPFERKGMDDLYKNKGVLLVAAAGNDGTTSFSYPASYDSVMSVAAIDSNQTVATFSQKNSQVELSAPGVGVLSTVPFVDDVSVTVGSASYAANTIEFAALGSATGALVSGGLGDNTDSAWAGKVVLVQRGSISFYEKVHNVQLSGGVACVIYNNEPGNFLGTLGDGNSSTIPAVSISQADGQALVSNSLGQSTAVSSSHQYPASGYASWDGTSMATPHVSGVAALIWSKYPTATNSQVRQALNTSALDLGSTGRDTSYGYGLVQAADALLALEALAGGSGGGGSGGGGGGGTDDTTAPVISNVSSQVTNTKNGSFEIVWTTDEPATSDVTIGGTMYSNSTLTTNHVRGFRGHKGALYVFYVSSTDEAGNTATAGPFLHQN